MRNENIIAQINGILADEFDVDSDQIIPNAIFRDTLALDSLDYVDLVVVIESNFGFKVKAEDIKEIHTFKDFYDYIIQKVATQKQIA